MARVARRLVLPLLVVMIVGAVFCTERRACRHRKEPSEDELLEDEPETETKAARCPTAPLDAVRINEAAEQVQLVETRKGPPARMRGQPQGTAVVATRCGQCDLQHVRDEEGVELTCFECSPVARPEAEEEVEEEEPEGSKRAPEEPKKPYQVSDGFFELLEQAARYEKELAPRLSVCTSEIDFEKSV
ncbi:uncharacterized protein LOC126335697 [Schistocerca gregaria]|uniref:uncharacterized protein LOC126335697 n=1 Tax=Schistocerca gregaria TaxID=7010 RepID=UPI00211EB7FA|nr:uncharacterized protein LOC126335697 [Schistocerca gregaria]